MKNNNWSKKSTFKSSFYTKRKKQIIDQVLLKLNKKVKTFTSNSFIIYQSKILGYSNQSHKQ